MTMLTLNVGDGLEVKALGERAGVSRFEDGSQRFIERFDSLSWPAGTSVDPWLTHLHYIEEDGFGAIGLPIAEVLADEQGRPVVVYKSDFNPKPLAAHDDIRRLAFAFVVARLHLLGRVHGALRDDIVDYGSRLAGWRPWPLGWQPGPSDFEADVRQLLRIEAAAFEATGRHDVVVALDRLAARAEVRAWQVVQRIADLTTATTRATAAPECPHCGRDARFFRRAEKVALGSRWYVDQTICLGCGECERDAVDR